MLFRSNNIKSVYKLTLKPYSVKLTDEIDVKDISFEDGEDYETLDNYFEELTNIKKSQDDEMEINPTVDTIEKQPNIDVVIKKPKVDKKIDSVWGEFA